MSFKNAFGYQFGRIQILTQEPIVKNLQFKDHFRIGWITGIKIFSIRNTTLMLTDKRI